MKLGLVLDSTKREAVDLSVEIEDLLTARDIEVVRDAKGFRGCDLVLVLGGDGTLLHVACENIESKAPFLGINVGKLGFLTAVESVDWQDVVGRIIRGEIVISERLTLDAKVEGLGKNDYRALNDVVVKSAYRVVELDIKVRGRKLLSISGDGVIVATQTGSTAYSLSAGGPIVDSHLDCLVITPINAHGLPIPSVVISPRDEVEVTIKKGNDVSLVVDGQKHTKVENGDVVKIKQGEYRVRLAYFDDYHFLKSLNAKFGLASRLVG